MTSKKTANDCTGSTCIKWDSDGSLSERDQSELMRRLCGTDPALAASDACKIYRDGPTR